MRKVLVVFVVGAVSTCALLVGNKITQWTQSHRPGVSFDKVNRVPLRARFGSSVQNFQEPLELNQCIAIRKGTNLLLLKFSSVDSLAPDVATFQVLDTNGLVKRTVKASEFVSVPPITFRWSSRDNRSIWIYEDPDIQRMSNMAYSVTYPLSSSAVSGVFQKPDSYVWLRYATNH
jgi:hypothetical protein